MSLSKTFAVAQSINNDRLSMKSASSMSSLGSTLTAKYSYRHLDMSPPDFEDFIDAEVHRVLHPDDSALPEPPYLLATIITALKGKFRTKFPKKQRLRSST